MLSLKNWCFWTVVLEKTFESPLDCKEIWPGHPKEDQSLMFIGRTDVEAETPILWPPDAKNWLIWKDSDAGKDWRQEDKGALKRLWCWERLKAGRQGGDKGWDGWMASPTQWAWVWVNSESRQWTGRPGVLQSMGSQRIRHNLVTELSWTEHSLTISD